MTTEVTTESDTLQPDTLRVSPLELFLDLVFVFTITQLSTSLVHHLDPSGLLRVMVVLAIIWWMYDAFTWATNAMPPHTHPRRGLLLLTMVSFLVIALTIPHAFEGEGVAFGWAYLVVVALHTGLFAVHGVAGHSVVRMGLLNTVNAGLVVFGGFLTGSAQLSLWVLAFALQFVIPRLVDLPNFQLRADHFVERHGLVIIIAFGESVIALGTGAATLEAGPLATALLALAVCVALWWAYFGHDDDEQAERVLSGLPDDVRNRIAVNVYNVGHYGLLLGVLLFTAGIRAALGAPTAPLSWQFAGALAGGVMLYLVTNAAIRRTLGLAPQLPRLVAAPVIGATTLLGHQFCGAAQTAVIAVLLAGLFGYEELAR
ncbi:low temperature requirement protein A [Kitasatospora sp. RB6PN24]|uniref:low temperature requirement protein A n=1 Tax=Kitasatospora humi TaxID=2893891 RepID=UPI001E4A428A|nr:low temperature requirement protein A [Kitasatospora humi]MCC9311353.1 low temperature requirement protein A [Kitasatospora humi]